MELWSLLAFGALVGMQHALEADHLAAVAALSARPSTRRNLFLRGAWWGLGHTLALFTICGAVLLLGLTLGENIQASLEFAVGIMVTALGLNVLWSIYRRRIHFHAHRHEDGRPHLHAHSHQAERNRDHADSPHDHRHPRHGLVKALTVGLMHGAAGSGALLVLLVAAANSPIMALAYIACFGLGSMAGMAALSFVASFPLNAAARGARWLHTATMATIGIFALAIGLNMAMTNWALAGF
ncbi:MAG: high frequency lysogenization protein HflD [Alphaproteobacteria bacterium]|nr:high frequency lysogenization protein HflD [Alphaproteobacteria bacterium]